MEVLNPQGLRKNSRQDGEKKVVRGEGLGVRGKSLVPSGEGLVPSGEWLVVSGKWLGTRQEAGGAGTRRRERIREIQSVGIYQVELYLKASRLSRGKCECPGRNVPLRSRHGARSSAQKVEAGWKLGLRPPANLEKRLRSEGHENCQEQAKQDR